MLAVQVIVSLGLYYINYMSIATIICVYVLLGRQNFESFLSLIVTSVLASTEEGGGVQEVNYIYVIPCPTGPWYVPRSGSSYP